MSHRPLKRLVLLLSLGLLTAATPTLADDTEIYTNPGVSSGIPMIMFYIEYSSDLAANIGCNNVDINDLAGTCSAISDLAIYMSDNDLTDNAIDRFELTRAALKRALAPLGAPLDSNNNQTDDLKVGIMMGHANENNCAGPSETDCSGGAYILQGLKPLMNIKGVVSDAVRQNFDTATQADLDAILANDPNKRTLFNKLDALRSPKGNFSHAHQPKENYFELFRYLTGQGVYNGHNGWKDYATDIEYNLGDWQATPSLKQGGYDCAVAGGCQTADSTDEYINGGSATGFPFKGDFALLENGNYVSTTPFKWDTTVESSANYISPLEDCAQVFVINVVDGGGLGTQNDADAAIKAPLASGGMGFNVSNNDPGFVQMVRWLHDKDLADGSLSGRQADGSTGPLAFSDVQNVVSFFIAHQTSQVDGAAAAGGTGTAIALTDNASEIAKTLDKILNSVISVSTTYTAASIPVNVFNRSEVLDNAYIALFQTDAETKPYWVGNIKKLKLDIYQICKTFAADGTTCIEYQNNLRLVDFIGQSAISELDGRIKASAVSFWTNRAGYDLADNIIPDLELPPDANGSGFDGRSVNRGGSGQQIPNFLNGNVQGTVSLSNVAGGRQLFTDYNNTLQELSMSNIGLLWPSIFDSQWDGATDYNLMNGIWLNDYVKRYSTSGCYSFYGRTTIAYFTPCYVAFTASVLLAYIRGKDVTDVDNDNNRDETRRWIFGDPLHSRPLPLNYGARSGSEGYTVSNPDIRIIAGSNDGFVRMIKNTTSSAGESGEEVWAFMPSEMLKIQKQLMDNNPNGTPSHPYGVDGAVSGYVLDTDGNIDSADGDKAWIFFGMRRGGRSYYGLDVTNPDTVPPVYKWKITPSTTGYAEMGYTFSQPVVRELDWGPGTQPVLIVGGGYDLDKDTPGLGTNDDIGNAVYIINAATGDLVWKVSGHNDNGTYTHYQPEMLDSIPSEVTAIDSDNDGHVDRVYVGDTGGRVWRLDLTGTTRADWKAEKILDVGRHYVSDLANDRRFFHAPDLVPGRDASGIYHAVVIGSGNRAHPLQTDTRDAVFMYKDWVTSGPLTNVNFTGPLNPTGLFNATDNCVQQNGATCNADNLALLSNGWVMYLPETGEKSLAAPMTLRGRVYFSTYVPYQAGSDITSCGPGEGAGFLYDVSLKDARAMYDYDTTNNFVDGENKITLQIEDRRRKLLSGGIPSENVYVSFRDGDDTYSGILPSDLSPGEDLGSQQWNTYWFEKGK